jgi:AraC family transcriptional regulator of adaptative response / DNA-3-methyladenine glycosylase II
MPRARVAALRGIAAAAVADPRLFACDGDLDAKIARLRALPGIGEWTAHYIAMRALREPDAFPAADVGLLRALAGRDRVRPTPAALLARAEAWRPWRAYAAQRLWSGGAIADDAIAKQGEAA